MLIAMEAHDVIKGSYMNTWSFGDLIVGHVASAIISSELSYRFADTNISKTNKYQPQLYFALRAN